MRKIYRLSKMSEKSGFTLIEMMVAVVVMGVITSVGVARYRQFNDKQKVLSAGKEVVTILKTAQKMAKSGDRPGIGDGNGACDTPSYKTLDGYKVRIVQFPPSLEIVAVCQGDEHITKSILLTNDTIFSSNEEFMFNGLSGGVSLVGGGNSEIITLTDPNQTISYQVEVTISGVINDLGEVIE